MASAMIVASSIATAAVMAPVATGCAPSADDDSFESSEQANTAQDLALAKEILNLLGGPNGRCKQCHGVTAAKVRAWGNAMKDVETSCFVPTTLTPSQRVSCLRSIPNNATSPFSAKRMGLYATAASDDQFKDLFEEAFPAATWSAEYVTFAQKAFMPRAGTALTAAEFAKLKGWVVRGMPQLDEAASGDAGAPDASTDATATDGSTDASLPGECHASTTTALATHLTAMKTGGWGARLADQATPMFGCGTSTTALACLTSQVDVTTTFGQTGVNQKLRRLRQQTLSSHYWVRSSADGRYVGYGMNSSAKIIDLTKPETSPGIGVGADYDPYFLASNDGFAFAGTSGGGIRVCRQSLLSDVASSPNPFITLNEPKCTMVGNAVYQSIGSALEGGKYFVTWGSHENDDGGHDVTAPLPAAFGLGAATTFTPMVNDGIAYRAQTPVNVALNGEGDMMLSPSSLLSATRFGTGTKQRGYRIRFIKSQQIGTSPLTIQTPLAAEVCLAGGKAAFSFDERFIATHQYVDLSEPDQAGLPTGSANIVVADLKTGTKVRITRSKAGSYALYPHFRADGWLYFIVRDMTASMEYVVASDVALRMPN